MITKAYKIIVGVILPIIVLVTFISARQRAEAEKKKTYDKQMAEAAAKLPQPEVEMELEWMLPDGQLDRGLNSDVLVVKHLEVSDESMSFDTPYSYGSRTVTGNYYLEKSGDRYKGSWSQPAPKDGGNIELKKIGKLTWVGPYSDRTGRQMTVTLRPKTRN